MRKTFFGILAACFAAVMLCACSAKPAETQDEGAFTIKRGTNLSHWLSQNNIDRGEARTYSYRRGTVLGRRSSARL